MKQPHYELSLVMRDHWGKIITESCINVQPPNRSTYSMELSPPSAYGLDGFDMAIDKMKDREYRRHMLKAAAGQLAGQMADYLEDKEGWHGTKRQAMIEKIEKEPQQ